MKIQNKLTIIFSCIFGLILFLFIIVVYRSYCVKVYDYYFDRLHLQAAVKVDLIDGGTVDKDVLHIIYANTSNNTEPWVTIYSDNGKLVYRDKKAVFSKKKQMQIYNYIKKTGQYSGWFSKYQLYGMLIQGQKSYYVAFAMGYDVRGISQLRSLRNLLMIAYVVAMLFIILAVRLFTRQAFAPVAKMTKRVSEITDAHLLDIRLEEGNKKDEIARLAIVFNNIFKQLKSAFEGQKQLVFNMSHELRTPVSAIITELELVRGSAKDMNDYAKSVEKVLHDSHRLVKLLNNLLDMAKANYGLAEIATHVVRLDEILLEACKREQRLDPEYNVLLVFDQEDMDDERLISLYGNEYLLDVAFSNLIDNACKFSRDKRCEVHISYENKYVVVKVEDHGIGIKTEELDSIFESFYRGNNRDFAEGNGIGLSLTKKIIEIHDGCISVNSEPGNTVFMVKLHNLIKA